ncbi:apolipoprotein N-acyltransferase [Lacinutrix undariae]
MKKALLAIGSGLLLALGWPTYGMPLLLFFAFVPLLFVEHSIRNSEIKHKKLTVFGLSYLSFFIWNYITTNWLQYADPFGASFAILVNSALMAAIIVMYHSISKRTTTNKALIFLIALWIAFEKLHLGWEFSWPWLNLGNGFSEYYTWIQWYEYTGTFGGTLWIWLVNILVFKSLVNTTKTELKQFLKPLAVKVILLIGLPIAASLIRYNTYTNQGDTVQVIAIQPNIDPYGDKYSKTNIQFADLLLELAETKITDSTDFILAPETYFADNIRVKQFDNSLLKHKLKSYVSEHPNLNILTGVSFINFIHNKADVKPQSNQLKDNLWYDDYNSAILINSANDVAVYNKSKLVVGVENFPYQSILKPLIGDKMIDLGGTVAMKTTQDYRTVFTGTNPKFKAAPIICYESVYGEFVTEYARNGANFLAIITNDAWWNNTQGHKQHLSLARLRAIETRRDVVRSANTGISAIINAKGDIVKQLEYDTQGALAGEITTNNTLTVYTKVGDLIARMSIFVMLGILCIAYFRKKKTT